MEMEKVKETEKAPKYRKRERKFSPKMQKWRKTEKE
jgi:hypothetical protein